MSTNVKGSVHVREEELVSGKWLGLTKVTFRDPAGKERTWEALRRMTKRPNAPADAVIIIPVLKRSLHYDCYILVKQYRPPTKGYTIEFPAEFIEVLTIPKEDFLQKLNEYSEKGTQVDARLYMYAVALEQTKKT